jgi:hypothetical protein
MFTDIYDIYNPGSTVPPLKKKLTVAVAKVAQTVLEEPGSTPNHEARFRWAKQALMSPEGYAQMMFLAVLGNSQIQAAGNDAPDADVEWMVGTLVNIFAA